MDEGILINSGSTHSFMNSKLAKKLKRNTFPTPTFQVNSSRLQREEMFQAVPIEIQRYWFRMSMYHLNMHGRVQCGVRDAMVAKPWAGAS